VTVILGINAYHGDASACIVVDGRLVAAVEEERFRRIKHWAGFPSESIRYCLREARATLGDVGHVAVNSDPRAGRLERITFLVKHRPDPAYVLKRLKHRRKRATIEREFETHFTGQRFGARIHRIEHHLAHLASAFYTSPFEHAAVVSVDGMGDFSSAAWGLASGETIGIDHRVHFPHSLGVFYEAMTQFIGFPHYGDEYKVMGLAPYGEAKYARELEDVVRCHEDGKFSLNLDYFRHATEPVTFTWEGGAPSKSSCMFSEALEGLLGPARAPGEPLEQRHKDLARSVQVTYERAFFNLLRAAHDQYGSDNLALAGGCGFNSVANGKVTRSTPFKHVYVQSAAGDAGGAVGAALQVHYGVLGAKTKHEHVRHAYLGPAFEEPEVAVLLRERADDIAGAGCTTRKLAEAELIQTTAQAIADGKVVGWFQGRLEWGPRALGNRSILGDPRRADMKDILNLKIKRRESFRPFAPSILRERVSAWFEVDDDVPFMMKVFPIREEKRVEVPAVTHVDGTGRLQTVYRDTNPRYYALIEAFERLTHVPMVLNTSFNENEPVVCRPVEALECFLRTKMDLLVLGEWVVERGE
jgi:carbamoyltransferase